MLVALFTGFVLQDEPEILIPYGDTYQYRILPAGESGQVADFYEMDFIEEGFLEGNTPFGSPGYAEYATDWPAPPAFTEAWDQNSTDLLLRTWFEAPTAITGLLVSIRMDNCVKLYLNGQLVSGEIGSYCGQYLSSPRPETITCRVSSEYLTLGEANLLAVRANNLGGGGYLDLQVAADYSPDSASAECTTTDIPPIPPVQTPITILRGVLSGIISSIDAPTAIIGGLILILGAVTVILNRRERIREQQGKDHEKSA